LLTVAVGQADKAISHPDLPPPRLTIAAVGGPEEPSARVGVGQHEPNRRSERLRKDHQGQGAIMADKSSLGILGFVFAAITAAVMLTAFVVVSGHVDGRLALDSGQAVASVSTTSVR
jgi:hypothetical protein